MDKQPKRTVPLNQPLTRFRKPSNHLKPATIPSNKVMLMLPDNRIVPVLPGMQLILGRGTTSPNGEHKIDLDSIRGVAEGISRNHALVTFTDGTLQIKDFNSTNGTYLNKTELYPMRNYTVRDGDTLILGKVKIGVKFVVAGK